MYSGLYKPCTGRTGRTGHTDRCMNHALAILSAPALIYQLMDVVDNIWISATAKNFVYSKAHMLIAPNSAGSVTKFENCTLKEALFEFLATIDRKV